jgi:activator of HSP90 ATPase
MVRALTAQQEEGPRKLTDIATLGGEIDVKARKSAKQFCDNFGNFINTYGEINSYIASRSKVIQSKAHDLADEFYGVASEIQRFSVLLRSTEIPQIQQLYDRLSQQVLRNGDFIL